MAIQRLVRYEIMVHRARQLAFQHTRDEAITAEVALLAELDKVRRVAEVAAEGDRREQAEIDRLTDLLPVPREASE